MHRINARWLWITVLRRFFNDLLALLCRVFANCCSWSREKLSYRRIRAGLPLRLGAKLALRGAWQRGQRGSQRLTCRAIAGRIV